MKWIHHAPLALAMSMLLSHGVGASTAYGDLNNFDAVNDTGQECHGFEIELDDIHSTDITYTFDWNHYGAPKIREDNSDPVHPKVFVRYESAKNSDGTWAAFTAVPAAPLTPTDGHSCTNPSVNQGCEHFGVGNYGIPTAVRYFWLVDSGSGNLVRGPAVMVASPVWNYSAPAGGQPAQAVAVIPAPVAPIPANKQFGEPSWVKVIKTTTHNANKIVLQDLISDDADGDNLADWQNQEPAEVESEWKLLQTNSVKPDKAALEGRPDDMGNGNETVTRRYEFYKYAGNPDTLDGETGEAMCDAVNLTLDPNDPNYLHGVGNSVAVTGPNGDTYFVDCSAQVVVGDYTGAQMAGFDAAAPLGLVDNIQDGELLQAYTPRTVVVGGNSPFAINVTGNFPDGLGIGAADGVLAGIPKTAGAFAFTVEATDADNVTVSKAYAMKVAGNVVLQYPLSVGKSGTGSGAVTSLPAGIDCGATCSFDFVSGTAVTLTPAASAGSAFTGWSGACTGSGACVVTMDAAKSVNVEFTANPPALASAVSRRAHGAAGTFDLPLSLVSTSPTVEPRQGPAQTIVFTFDKPIAGVKVTVSEGAAAAGAPTFSGNDVIVGLTGVTNQQYVTVTLNSVTSVDGGTGGSGTVRVGFLLGDVNQSRTVTLSDLGQVNVQIAQLVTAANYLKDVNASGTLSLADKGITNTQITMVLPAP